MTLSFAFAKLTLSVIEKEVVDMNEPKHLLSELELMTVDLRRSADDLENVIKRVKVMLTTNRKDVFDRDTLICLVINERFKKLTGLNTLEKQEKRLLKQLKKSIKRES